MGTQAGGQEEDRDGESEQETAADMVLSLLSEKNLTFGWYASTLLVIGLSQPS